MKSYVLLVFLLTITSVFSQSHKEKHNISIQLADSCFAIKDYVKAKKNYEIALQYKPKEMYPLHKIAEICAYEEKNLSVERFYNKADSCFTAKDFVQAKQNYINVLLIKAHETKAKHRIAEIDEILHNQGKK